MQVKRRRRPSHVTLSVGPLTPARPCISLSISPRPQSQLLSFFEDIGEVKEKVTLEEMIRGFRKIRREWATVSAEKAGQAVLVRVVELMKRAGMSLEDWFSFMDSSQVRFGFVVCRPGLSPFARDNTFQQIDVSIMLDLVFSFGHLVPHMTQKGVCATSRLLTN